MELTKGSMPYLLVESGGFEGVRRIAEKVATDIEKVTGVRPEVRNEKEAAAREGGWAILCATLGKSPLLEELAGQGLADPQDLMREDGSGKWEVYQIRKIAPEGGVRCGALRLDGILLICGSDKRGTIYGMFSLSEYIGVSPFCFWGDVEPVRRESVLIGDDIETLSKEPSVKYRGFFINDEWPCFGSWVTEHFGGFNAKAYEQVFEFLLRLKGNYLWPAMWTASFPLDGPGSANEELADLYGVVMGYSHHEPCLRASEEWDKVRGEGSRYGNEWNYYTNAPGLLHYWEDSLKRSGGYENIITIGMRGERDSSMLGPDASLGENISLLKEIITRQKELIGKHVRRESGEAPMMLALYKEVEPYFYGDENTPGLKDWEGLEGVTCMLCEDNYGYVRTLPTEELRNRRGGFGMYYHFDYHGAPVSYEWVDCTPFSRTWEQMGQAYEYGVRDIWIVNVGDLKFHEVSLGYFLALAYDYDRWGYSNPDSYGQYTKQWVQKTFPLADHSLQEKIDQVLNGYIQINALRRPEALHPGIYHSCHYEETDRMLERAERLEELSRQALEELGTPEEKQAYYSMIHYPAAASMNVLKMHLYAGKNYRYAAQGRTAANLYRQRTRDCIQKDREYAGEWAAFRDGKWSGMELEQHIGFTRWNDDDYRYPVLAEVEPAHRPRLSVSRKDEERTATKTFGAPMVIRIPDFQYAGCGKVTLEIANSGCGSLHYRIRAEKGAIPEWLTLSSTEGEAETLQEVVLECRRDLLPKEAETVRLLIDDGEAKVAVEVVGRAVPWFDFEQDGRDLKSAGLPGGTFTDRSGVYSVRAEHYCRKKDVAKGSFQKIGDYGKHGSGMKVFPCTAAFGEGEEKPELVYRLLIREAGEYRVELFTAPSNPLASGQSVNLLVRSGKGEQKKAEILPANFRAGDFNDGRWSAAALNQEHKTSVTLSFEEGVQELVIGALEAGTVLEKILVCREKTALPDSYLGPEETGFFTGGTGCCPEI